MALLLLPMLCVAADLPVVRTLGPQKNDDVSHAYFTTLLRNSLQGQYRLETIEYPGQGRAIKLLEAGEFYDVMWSGSSQQRNDNLIRISVPLFKGGLGIRAAVLHRRFHDSFVKIKTLQELQRFSICQGRHWPDADVLEAAGLHVVRVHSFEAMLSMLTMGRCDLLFLSIFEGKGELDAVKEQYPDLLWDTHLLLRYHTEMYFYVNEKSHQLAAHLETKLIEMMENGEFLQFMASHTLTRHAFPLSQFEQSIVIAIGEETDKPFKKWVFDW